MICSRCGNEVAEGTKYCPNCGNRMSGDHDSLAVIIKIVSVFAAITLGLTALFSLLNLILLFTNYTHGLFHFNTSVSSLWPKKKFWKYQWSSGTDCRIYSC